MKRGALALLFTVAVVGCPTAAATRTVAAPPPTAESPASLVVALALGDPGLQAGVVRGGDVILARGFEVELARLLARRLGARVDRFVYVPSTTRLLAATATGWQLGLAGIDPSRGGAAGAAFSAPYLTTDVAVVTRRGLDAPRRLADLRPLALCALRGGDAARTAATVVRPKRPTVLATGDVRLLAMVQTGSCDAALVPAVQVGRFVEGHRRVIGSVAVRIRRGEGLVAVVPSAGGLDVQAVNRELGRLRRDGTLSRLARTWLRLDPAGLRVLR